MSKLEELSNPALWLRNNRALVAKTIALTSMQESLKIASWTKK